MNHIHFDVETDGFYGAYWACNEGSSCAIIAMLPVGSALFVKWAFAAAREYPQECRETRIDIEKRMCRVLTEWKDSLQ